MQQYETLTFEQAIEQLDEIVQNLEKGNVPLADMVALYEEGVALSKHCMQILDAYDEKLEMLSQPVNGESEEE